MKNLIPVIFFIIMLVGGLTTSCKHYSVNSPDTTHKCDTCCDTCKTDTTKPPCDTCNIDKDSAAHAFIWTEYTNPSERQFTGVWVFGPNDIYVNGGTLWHFDGTTFSKIDARNATHNNAAMSGVLSGSSIFAFTQKDFWIVGGSISYHTIDGQYFDDYRAGSVNACWGSAPNDVFIVGNSGQISHFNGTKFDTMNSGTTKNLRSVWGTSHNDVWACGYNTSTGETILLHFDGQQWSEDALSSSQGIFATGGFNSVWTTDSSNHKIIVTSGGILKRKTDNGAWRSDSGLISNRQQDGTFIGIGPAGNTINDFMVIGPWGFLSHWNGKTWKQYTELFNYGNPVFYSAGFSMKDNTACVVGIKSGASWIAVGRRK